ncbi:phosphoribosyltransferase [Cereibacter sediminicola]|uniref:phosphoribosyltransferase n=1 Tax=Cereibacter sediminicola TaxID=2584941 RepID=UPI0011A8999A|nr:phosphoribosyltransferase [Cereibacter sediminicola]
MNYRSITDLADMLQHNLHRLPRDTDLVVGLPEGGMLAANILCLLANVPMADLESFLAGRSFSVGRTKLDPATGAPAPQRVVAIAVTEEGVAHARARLEAAGLDVTLVVAYGSAPDLPGAGLVLEALPEPRIFQWSFMQHPVLEQACVDIDGVLCLDPTQAENDDGAAYLQFLASARPLYRPTRRIGTLVTSRLEKYRSGTEEWLAARGISYGRLVMLDLPSQAERIRLGAHGSFKAEVYRQSDAPLFIESENRQARRIAELSGKPVLCLESHRLLTAGMLSAEQTAAHPDQPALRMAKAIARGLLGPSRVASLKRRFAR